MTFASCKAALSKALKRHGRVVVLRESVITSGRKLRTHSASEILTLLARLAFRPRQGPRDRELWGILYDQRRPDPVDRERTEGQRE
jgi:hypothetical protein